ncbi:hypothetical protein MTR67_052462 [Solanum verrucosum]|uniref:Reverse transcriptase domain-containing protein n=1 Tax=Solanum verrucosum TaxID=315347 RepID=A0AAF0V680_SOLVR|nr:hypothetical protein MTR67_052462 [Solanum verrucosum]
MGTTLGSFILKGRRRKLQISELQTREGDWITTSQNIREEVVAVFKEQFQETQEITDYSMLQSIPKLITAELNVEIERLPEKDEVKKEIIRDISRRNQLYNVVVKLDMTKAYDRVSWKYLIQVLRRGLKQGDPLSSTLFIIVAEVFARSLNNLFEDLEYKGYGMPKWNPKINHLSYADDTILFCLGQPFSMRKMIKVLIKYEDVSRQLINLDKSLVYLHEKVPIGASYQIRRITGIRMGSFPFTYLGCPMFYERKNKSHFEVLIKKVAKRMHSWQNRLLSFGRRYILIAHVLQSMSIYILSAMNPPKSVLVQLHKLFAKIFWGNYTGASSKHWVSWENMCYPKKEGGCTVLYRRGQYKGGGDKDKNIHHLGNWDETKLLTRLSQEIIEYIIESIKPSVGEGNDTAWWMGNTQGAFTVKFAWQQMRKKKEGRRDYDLL